MFKVTISNLGRNKATEVREFEEAPYYEELYGMAAKYLLSSDVDFYVKSGNPNDGVYPVSGYVAAGFHNVGDFMIEELEEAAE